MEASLQEDSVAGVGPLAMVAVATHLSKERVREALASATIMWVDDLDVVGVPVWWVRFRGQSNGHDH